MDQRQLEEVEAGLLASLTAWAKRWLLRDAVQQHAVRLRVEVQLVGS